MSAPFNSVSFSLQCTLALFSEMLAWDSGYIVEFIKKSITSGGTVWG